MALRIDEDESFLSTPASIAIRAAMADASACLERSQQPDGAWSLDWALTGGQSRNESLINEAIGRVRVTGHHLEWIAVAPVELRPSAKAVRQAIQFLLTTLSSQSPEYYYDNYAPVSHAVRALVLLSGIDCVMIIRNDVGGPATPKAP
jgi:hypothetical protein